MSRHYDEKLKIWYGKKKPFKFDENDSLGSAALQCLLDDPNQIAQICYQSGRVITNMEMAKLAVQVACSMEKLQLNQGTVIGMCVANSDYVAPMVLGCLMTGLIISTLDPSFDVDGIKHIYSQTKPKIMICDDDIYWKVRKACDACGLTSSTIYTMRNHIDGIPSVLEFFKDTVDVKGYRVPPLKYGQNQTAFILCSSGTTGLPKAVTVSHGVILLSDSGMSVSRPICFCFSTLYWLSGVLSLMLSTLLHRTRIISEHSFSPEDFFDIIQTYRVTVVTGTPSQIALALASTQLMHSDLASIQIFRVVGSKAHYTAIKKFKNFARNAKFVAVYGMTECGCKVTEGNCEPGDSVGFLMPNMEVKIINDAGDKLPPNVRGQICVRSPLPWAGYYGNPEATKAVYDSECWYHSGDVGFFNDEGKLFIVDRIKDILKYNNFHFCPSVIENIVNEIPDVLEACVVGIPDESYGFLPAVVVIKQAGSAIRDSDIHQYVKDRVQHFEQLRGGVYFVERFPRTASGKIQRHQVARLGEKMYKLERENMKANKFW